MKFVVDKVALRQSFIKVIPLPPVSMIHQCAIIICIYVVLLREGQTGKVWELSKKTSLFGLPERLDKKTTLFFYLVTKANNILCISGVRVPLQRASRVWDSMSDDANITINR